MIGSIPKSMVAVTLLFFVLLQLPGSMAIAQAINVLQPKSAITFAFVSADDGARGSTMTLQELQQAQKKSEEIAEPLRIHAAGEPSPALKYRLYPARWELQPGSAVLHYTRAQILFLQLPKETQIQWQMWYGEDKTPTDDELANAVVSLQQIFNELHNLAQSEDLTWDHRIRDLRGPEVYAYLLPDVQEARSMARLLRLKIKHQLKQKDFDGAISAISDGMRLAEFVGQGETVIQKLVGIAIMAMMRECIVETISTAGSPNLYWALASVPQPLIDMREAVLWELGNIQNVLPALKEAETANWSDAEAAKKWTSLVADLGTLGAGDQVDGISVQLVLAIAGVMHVDAARERLLTRGVSEERLAKMPVLQIVLLDASQELKNFGDELGKGHLLPASISKSLLERENGEYEDWIRQHRTTSVGAAIGGLLFPAVRQARTAETRTLMNHNRLMTLEAIRMHAAEHSGELPKSLAELNPAPAMPDPTSGQGFEYSIESTDEQKTIVLKAAEPLNWKQNQEFRATLVK
ncbi:MAG: hypothetical protein KDB01_04245 [Planctomycetaceae bacterium]|nr:hypothetical protein [Planctomycetaceae bacterium]